VFEAPLVENGSTVASESLRGQRVLLAFTSPGCATCETTFGVTLAAASKLHAQIVLVCNGPQEECREFARRRFPSGVALWDRDGKISTSFGVRSTPISVALDEQWHVMKYGAPGIADDVPPLLHVVPPATSGAPTAAGDR
jgi:peroxiredoxin